MDEPCQTRKMHAPALGPGCPWSGWLPPDIKWCEENLCSWITTPANTFSNLAFFVVGFWILRREARGATGQGGDARFGWIALLLGASSFVYHASYTFFFQFFDFFAMYVFVLFLVRLNLARILPHWSARVLAGFHWGGVALLSILVIPFYRAEIPLQLTVMALVVVALLSEILAYRAARFSGPRDYRYFKIGFAMIALAGTCSILDKSGLWCEPTRHWLQGHALWHVFSALSVYGFYRFHSPNRDARPA